MGIRRNTTNRHFEFVDTAGRVIPLETTITDITDDTTKGVINICTLLDVIVPNSTHNDNLDHPRVIDLVTAWLEENGCNYYAAPRECFRLTEAIEKAGFAPERCCVVEDLS